MKSDYLIDRETLALLRELYRQSREEHPACEIGFGWGSDSTGRMGVNCGLYYDRSQPMPPIYLYEDVSIHIAFPENTPQELKAGVICFRGNHFEILPVEDFAREQLVEGILEQGPE
ncbi:MAG: hypothetical protein QNJ30_23895 [Kiloniellales bacterium]|nr:hypothetical protein [Kiloniellales bacterium]